MNVLIIEDEIHNAARLKQILTEINPMINVLAILESVADSVEWLSSNESVALIFMDVRLSDGICFEIFYKIRIQTPVIFTTAYDEYALKAFKVNSIDYLLKPIDKEELQAALQKHFELTNVDEQQVLIKKLYDALKRDNADYRSRFLIQKKESFLTVEVDAITVIYSMFKNTYLVLNDKTEVRVNITLDEAEAELDPRLFFRANRQYIIKMAGILSIHAYFNGKLKIIMDNPDHQEIIISKEKSVSFKKWLDK